MRRNEGSGGGMSSLQVRRMTYAAIFLALAMVLPLITGQIPEIASRISPMHLPVLLCGFLCGWPWGLLVGFVAPLLRSVTFGMPAMFPGAVSMAFELAVYGGMSGWLYRALPKWKGRIYLALVPAMIAGRIAWGTVRWLLAGLSGSSFTWAAFLAGAVTNALPAIALQLVLIPILVTAMDRAGLSALDGKE